MTDATVPTGTATPFAVWSRDADARPGTPLLVLLHGYGSHEQDLMGLVPALPGEFSVASVRAPQPAGFGYQWFPLAADLSFSLDRVAEAVEPVAAWLRELAADHPSTTLLGFSQGMAMATSLARHMPGEIAAVVGLSGFVVPGEHPLFADEQLRERPLRMFWGRDPQDPVIPQELVDSTAEWALEHADVMKVHYTGVGHGISPQEVGHVREYLTQVVLGDPDRPVSRPR
ncbi:phospholipase [Kocuria rosea]|jgi:phospholipase/carboxylesterase|uniref:alpha/beta hydrolase n=1 Tax=Kocuria TaxID=57493 RepID=UPI000D65CB25|nr:alpha/beta fold hydrolase [Kocuria rosea]MCM3486443.1 phospholipase [Kocuria rosea]MEB2527481.1 phospholipase [Kocuria rosea]MEB2619686.1 phospholipase [Kocuria rosea]PWF85964.1 phospholipase [Kocuria rosea]QCY33516.1 phospholipase [Kocuria rosea]